MLTFTLSGRVTVSMRPLSGTVTTSLPHPVWDCSAAALTVTCTSPARQVFHVTFSSGALVSIKVTHLSFNSTGSCSVYSPSTEGTSVHLKVFLPFAHRQEEYWPSEEGVRVKSDEGAGVAVTYQRGFMFNTHSKPQWGICLEHTQAFNQL